MSALTITAAYGVPTSFSSTLGALTLAWTGGVSYAPLQLVLDRLNIAFGAACTFALNPLNGKVIVTPVAPPYTLVWGQSSLPLLLGFTAHLVTIDQTVTQSDTAVLGWWSGAAASPWGVSEKRELADVVSLTGRLTVTALPVRTSVCRLWLHRRNDDLSCDEALDAFYQVVQVWAAYPLALTDEAGITTSHVLVEGWECAPQLLDVDTVYLDLETQQWA
jgi:hypothetical protein